MKKDVRRLPVWRAERELTQFETAAMAGGMSRSRYWQIEAGVGAVPSDDEKSAIAAALGVKVPEVAWPQTVASCV